MCVTVCVFHTSVTPQWGEFPKCSPPVTRSLFCKVRSQKRFASSFLHLLFPPPNASHTHFAPFCTFFPQCSSPAFFLRHHQTCRRNLVFLSCQKSFPMFFCEQKSSHFYFFTITEPNIFFFGSLFFPLPSYFVVNCQMAALILGIFRFHNVFLID